LIASIALILILTAFIDTTYYLGFGILFGITVLLYSGVRLFFGYRHEAVYMLFNLRKPETEAMRALIVETAIAAQIPEDTIEYLDRFPYVYRIKIHDRKAVRRFNKTIDETLKKRFNYRFFYRYVLFLMIFVILAMIWRY